MRRVCGGRVHDVVHHSRRLHLARRDLLAHAAAGEITLGGALVDQPRGVQHEQPQLVDLHPRVGDRGLYQLFFAEQASLGMPGGGALAHHVERLFAHRYRAHRVMDPATTEPGLSHHKRLALTTEDVRLGYADVVVPEPPVVAFAGTVVHGRHVAPHGDSGRAGRHQDHRHALVGAHVRVRHGHHDEEGGDVSVGREELLSVDHPVIPVPHRPGGEELRIRARVRFGHREAGEYLALQQRGEVLRLLFIGAVLGEDLRVTGIGGLRTENQRRPAGTAENLVQQRQSHLAVSLAAEIWFEVRRP